MYKQRVRIFKRETAAYWVDIYFFGGKVADSFQPDLIPGVLRWSRIGPTQVQILTTNQRSVEAAAVEHERAQLEIVRQERLAHLATLPEVQPLSEPVRPASVPVSKPKKKSGCRGCGKK